MGQVLERMKAALVHEVSTKPGSIERSIAAAAYNAASAEMERRMYNHAAAKIRARRQADDADGDDDVS